MENPSKASDVNPADYNLIDFTFACLPIVGLIFLLLNYCIAIYRSRDDAWSIVSILVSSFDLVFLSFILHVFKWPRRDTSSLRGKLNAAVWVLATLLKIVFSYGTDVPPAIAITAWSIAVATILGIYYAFFIYKESDGHQIVGTKDDKNSP